MTDIPLTMSAPFPLKISRLAMSAPCRACVQPGTGSVEGELEERTEYCATDAWWLIGASLSICDAHFRLFCHDSGIDYGEAARLAQANSGKPVPNEDEQQPWELRRRYASEVARIPRKSGGHRRDDPRKKGGEAHG